MASLSSKPPSLAASTLRIVSDEPSAFDTHELFLHQIEKRCDVVVIGERQVVADSGAMEYADFSDLSRLK